MSIEFPLSQKQTSLGLISDPKIQVAVRTLAGYRFYRFLIDTGADFSLAPRRLGQQVGMTWDLLPEIPVTGVGQSGIPARLGHLPLRLGTVDFTVRCLLVDAPIVPFLLGRADFLDHFVLTIDQPKRRVTLTEIS